MFLVSFLVRRKKIGKFSLNLSKTLNYVSHTRTLPSINSRFWFFPLLSCLHNLLLILLRRYLQFSLENSLIFPRKFNPHSSRHNPIKKNPSLLLSESTISSPSYSHHFHQSNLFDCPINSILTSLSLVPILSFTSVYLFIYFFFIWLRCVLNCSNFDLRLRYP